MYIPEDQLCHRHARAIHTTCCWTRRQCACILVFKKYVPHTCTPLTLWFEVWATSVYSRRRSKKYQSFAWLAFVRGIHRWPVNSPHKGPVTRKMFPFDDVIMHCFVKLITAFLSYTFKRVVNELLLECWGLLASEISVISFINERWRYFVTTPLIGWVQT